MRLALALDRYLRHCQLERDFSPRSLDSYYRILVKLVDAYPEGTLAEFEGREGKERVRAVIADKWGHTSATNRGKVISYFHSWFAWAESEDLIEDERIRQIKRPPRRRADVYRPPADDREAGLRVTTVHERAAWVLMDKTGLRASEVCALRWADVDLRLGEVHVRGKGGHRDVLPVIPEALEILRAVYRELAPEPAHHVFTVETVEWHGYMQHRARRDPSRPARTSSLWEMVRRVCRRAGVKEFGPHALRHGFAVSFLRDSGRDVAALQELMRHESIATTRRYLDDLTIEELRAVLDFVTANRRRTSAAETGNKRAQRGQGAANPQLRPAGVEPAFGSSSQEAGNDEDDSSPLAGDFDPEGGHK